MLSIAAENQMYFIHDSCSTDFIYDTGGGKFPEYGYIKVSFEIILNLFEIQINVHVI